MLHDDDMVQSPQTEMRIICFLEAHAALSSAFFESCWAAIVCLLLRIIGLALPMRKQLTDSAHAVVLILLA